MRRCSQPAQLDSEEGQPVTQAKVDDSAQTQSVTQVRRVFATTAASRQRWLHSHWCCRGGPSGRAGPLCAARSSLAHPFLAQVVLGRLSRSLLPSFLTLLALSRGISRSPQSTLSPARFCRRPSCSRSSLNNAPDAIAVRSLSSPRPSLDPELTLKRPQLAAPVPPGLAAAPRLVNLNSPEPFLLLRSQPIRLDQSDRQ